MAKPSTRATAKYHAKIGLVSKSYKLKNDVVESFKLACEAMNESQAAVLMRFMTEYAQMSGGKTKKQEQFEGQMELFTNTNSESQEPKSLGRTHLDWVKDLEKAEKKNGLPCVYGYGCGGDGLQPHVYVDGKKIFIPVRDIDIFLKLGAVYINNQ